MSTPVQVIARVSANLQTPEGLERCRRALEEPLSLTEMQAALPGVWIGMYNDAAARVRAAGSLRRWLASIPTRAAVILYRWRPTYGHWICTWLQDDGKLQLFDSMGNAPDTLQSRQDPTVAASLGQGRRALVGGLLRQPAYYNDHALQGARTQVCGRWCILRLRLRNLSEDDFALLTGRLARYFRVPRDVIVCAATL